MRLSTDSSDPPSASVGASSPETPSKPSLASTSSIPTDTKGSVPPTGRQGRRVRWKRYAFYLILLLVSIAATAYGVILIKHAITNERTKIERRFEENTQHWQAAQIQGQQTLEKIQKLNQQLTDLSVQVEHIQAQQTAFDAFYQNFTRDRAHLTLLEIRRVLETANGQLSLTGNVSLARFALQGALARLTGLQSPKVQAVRAALTQDLVALEAIPVVDSNSMAALLDMAYAQIDALPLAGEVRQVAAAPLPAQEEQSAPAQTEHKATFSLKNTWNGLWDGFIRELRTLVQVRRIDDADAMRISPQEGYFLRENIKLRLLSARLAVLSRHDGVLTTDLQAIDNVLKRYFDPASAKTQLVRSAIEKVRGMPKNSALPSLKASLDAIGEGGESL